MAKILRFQESRGRLRICGEIRGGKQERRDSKEGQGNPHRLLDSLIHANTFFSFVGVKDKSEREGGALEVGGGGDDTGRTDRKTGRRRWEMERKGGEREQERAPLPSLNLSCSDQ